MFTVHYWYTLWTSGGASLHGLSAGFDSYRTVTLLAGGQTEQYGGNGGLYLDLLGGTTFLDRQRLSAGYLSIIKTNLNNVILNLLILIQMIPIYTCIFFCLFTNYNVLSINGMQIYNN